MTRSTRNTNWQVLSTIRGEDGKLIEMMATTCEDGIGIIARWLKRAPASRFEVPLGHEWIVSAMDTEGGGMKPVTEFLDNEVVPPEPPDVEFAWEAIEEAEEIINDLLNQLGAPKAT